MPAFPRRVVTAAATLAVAASCMAWPSPAAAAPAPPPDACATAVLGDGTVPRTFVPASCDLTGRKVRTPAGELTVPPAGHGVGAERVLAGGRTVTAVVEHRPDGTVVASATPPATAAANGRSDTGCDGTAYELAGNEFVSPYRWWFNAGGLPGPGRLRDAVIRGLEDVTQRQTDCRATTPLPGAVQPQYLGATTVAPGITPDAGCGTDGKSVVGFGPLEGGWWAMSCWWWDAVGTVEADVLFAADQRWWTNRSISTCGARIDVEGLAAHEFGHVFGLLHVDEGAHPDQTMSTYINGYCSKVERTLGTGDLAGLTRLYGP